MGSVITRLLQNIDISKIIDIKKILNIQFCCESDIEKSNSDIIDGGKNVLSISAKTIIQNNTDMS